MKTLAVCGCSFMWSSKTIYDAIKGADWPIEFIIDYDQWQNNIKKECKVFNYVHWPHFTDIYSREKNFKVLHLAEGGASNFSIRVQIDRAIKEKVDYVIVAATDPSRFEFPILEDPYFSCSPRFKRYKKQLDSAIVDAIKNSVVLQNDFLNNHKNYYYLQSGLYKLSKVNIPYIFIPGPLSHLDWTDFDLIWPDDKLHPWHFSKTRYYSLDGNHIPAKQQYELAKILSDLTAHWQ